MYFFLSVLLFTGSSELGDDGDSLHWQVSLPSCPTLLLPRREGWDLILPVPQLAHHLLSAGMILNLKGGF